MMEFGEREILKRVAEQTEENNKILRRLQGDLRWRRFLGWGKILVVIALALGAYYYLQPWIEPLLDTYQTVLGQFEGLRNGLQLSPAKETE